MPRRKHLRKIVEPPQFKAYIPVSSHLRNLKPVELLYEEYEALKLADYDGLHHHEACKKMGISRPTFARIYQSARNKIAVAFVEVRQIQTVYGNVVLDKNWYHCIDCNARFSLVKEFNFTQCPLCSSENTEPLVNNSNVS